MERVWVSQVSVHCGWGAGGGGGRRGHGGQQQFDTSQPAGGADIVLPPCYQVTTQLYKLYMNKNAY